MGLKKLSYHCSVCQWRGSMEPFDFGDSAPCPNCGVYLYPLSWGQTWGVTIGIIAACLALIFLVVFLG